VRFFDSADDAAAAGFRACKRCAPADEPTPSGPERAIRRATRYLRDHADTTVSLAALARVAGLSAFHLQRQFKSALGLSPRQYQAACRASRFRRELRAGRDVTTAMYEAGYGSPSRLYEGAPTGRGMSPAAYRLGGEGLTIGFVVERCALGWLLVAATAKGVCAVKLADSPEALEDELRREFPRARIVSRTLVQPGWVRAVLRGITGSPGAIDLPLDIRGTAFQWRVWRALQQIPAGDTRSYSDIARQIGQPSAVRAVAGACARNPVCLVIPCHRVVGKDGSAGGYRWGSARKADLLSREKKRSRIAPE
jgi:AraC family transcriptional regulator of adaptative response/methylated-DNA-[protein]-cysteine methyltransferase